MSLASHFDGIEIGGVGRQEQKPGAAFLEAGGGLLALMAGQIVEDNDVAWLERGSELGFNPCLKDRPVHRLIDQPGSREPIKPQPGDERLGSPMTEWGAGFEPLSAQESAPRANHPGGGAGVIDEDQAMELLAHLGRRSIR